LRVRARAYELLGEFNKALADLETALESAQRNRDSGEEWEALIATGVLWLSRDYDRAGQYFDRALILSQKMKDRRREAHSLNRVGNRQMNLGDPPGALACHHEALAIFRELNDPEGMAGTLDLLGMTSYHSLNLADQISYHTQAVELFRQLGERQGAISSLSLLALSSTSYDWPAPPASEADFESSIAAGEEALSEAQAIGWRAGESFACYALAMSLGAHGDYDRALALGQDGLRIAEDIQHEQWQVASLRSLAEIELDLLDFEQARSLLARGLALAREIKSAFWTTCLSAALARALTGLAQIRLASTQLESFERERPRGLTSWFLACAEAEIALARKDYVTALELASTWEHAVWPDGRCSRLTLLRAQALSGLKRLEESREVIDRMLATGPLLTAPLLWRAQLMSGRVEAAMGRRVRAAQAYRGARVTVERLARSIDDAARSQAFLSRASALVPHSRRVAQERARARERFEGLTQREREVAALVARGQSNREIAETLFLSDRTVAVHVANVLAKLNFGSRSQIASWATARGLLDANHSA
jgi:DNA-binding CsgD family transcriptional regulator